MTSPDQGPVAVLSIVIPLIIVAGLYVWTSFMLAKVFARLGIASWKAWVPVLNLAEILAKGGIPAWQVVLLFVPIANLFGIYQLATAYHRINLAFGKGVGMTVLAVLLLPVWATIIGSEAAAAPQRAGQEEPVSDSVPPPVVPQPAPQPAAAPPVPPAAQPPVPPAAAPQPPEPLPVATPAAPIEEPVAEPVAEPASLLTTPAPQPPIPLEPEPAEAALPPIEPTPAEPTPAEPTPPPVAAPVPLSTPQSSTFAPPPSAPAAPAAPIVAPVIAPPPGFAAPAAPPVEAPVDPVDPVDPGQVVLEEPMGTPEPATVDEPVAEAPVQPIVLEQPLEAPVEAPAAAPVESLAEVADEEEEEDRTVVVEDDEPDEEEEEDRTVVVDRRPAIVWQLVTEDGERLPLTSASVVLGRKPVSMQGSTVIAVPDETKTLSKVHARLDLVDEVWTITDLGSTNGVLIVEPDGAERELDRDASSVVTGSFVLGKVVLAIERVEDAG